MSSVEPPFITQIEATSSGVSVLVIWTTLDASSCEDPVNVILSLIRRELWKCSLPRLKVWNYQSNGTNNFLHIFYVLAFNLSHWDLYFLDYFIDFGHEEERSLCNSQHCKIINYIKNKLLSFCKSVKKMLHFLWKVIRDRFDLVLRSQMEIYHFLLSFIVLKCCDSWS